MKNVSALLLIILLSLSLSYDAAGQKVTPERDKYVLLTMPYNQRPLNLYRGQVQANAGYKFAVRAQSFNADGDLVYLKNYGTGSVYHYYFVNLRYGLTSFIELGAETNFLRRGIREASVTVVSTTLTSAERITVNKLTESRGMGDIFLYTALRLPVQYKWFDIDITGGIFLPTSGYEPEIPSNTITSASLASENTSTINLHYNNTNGYGVPVYLLATASKISYKDFTVEAEWTMRTPGKEGQNIRWEETLAEKSFSYYNQLYSYLLSDIYTFDFSLHYQATGWFNLSLNGSFFRTKGGWTEYWGNKYRNPEKKLINLEPGFELQISPGLKICQLAGFPLSGKNNDAPFYMFTTLSYSIFPFMR
ncbi:MAG: hypothetical protein IQL11_06365 [Bacteroidales bacterium]|nr:hypothetical protein [Bacteroidales bacterium]